MSRLKIKTTLFRIQVDVLLKEYSEVYDEFRVAARLGVQMGFLLATAASGIISYVWSSARDQMIVALVPPLFIILCGFILFFLLAQINLRALLALLENRINLFIGGDRQRYMSANIRLFFESYCGKDPYLNTSYFYKYSNRLTLIALGILLAIYYLSLHIAGFWLYDQNIVLDGKEISSIVSLIYFAVFFILPAILVYFARKSFLEIRNNMATHINYSSYTSSR